MTTPPSAPPVKLVALSGSMRANSNTRRVMAIALEGVAKFGAEVTLVDLHDWRLPPFDGEPAKNAPETLRFRKAVSEADGLLIAAPVYHDSIGGMLKNALDLLYFEELQSKVVAMIAVGGGRVGHGVALEHLRSILRETDTFVIPRQVAVGAADQLFDEQGKAKDEEIVTRLQALGQELVLRTKLLRPKRRMG